MDKLTDRIRRVGKRAKSNLPRTVVAGDNTDAASSGTATPPTPATADELDAAVDDNVRDQAAGEVDGSKSAAAVQTKVFSPAAAAVLDQQQGATAAAAAAPTDALGAATLSSLDADAAPSRRLGFEASPPTAAVAAPIAVVAAPELLPDDKPLAAMLQPLADNADISMTQDMEPADDSAVIAADSALTGPDAPAAEITGMGDAAAADDASADAGGLFAAADGAVGDGAGAGGDGAETAAVEVLMPQSAAAEPVPTEPEAAEPVAAAASANGVAAGIAAAAGGAESQPVEIEADGDVAVPAAAAANRLPGAPASATQKEAASGRQGVQGFVLGMVQYAVQSIVWALNFVPDRLKSAIAAWLVITTLVLPIAFIAATATFAAALFGLAFNFTVFPLLAFAWPPAAKMVLQAFDTGIRVAKQQAAQLGL